MHTYYLLPFKLPLYQTFLVNITAHDKSRYLIPVMYSHFSKMSLKIQVRMKFREKKKQLVEQCRDLFYPPFKELSVINSTF